MRFCPRWAAIAPLTLLCGVGCASPSLPPAPEPVPEAVALGPLGSESLAFMAVIERIPAGTLLGTAHWKGSSEILDEIRATGDSRRERSFNVAITDLLREHGYNVRDEADAVFEPRTVHARYLLAGVLHDADVDYAYERRHSNTGKQRGNVLARAVVEFELQVYDPVRRQTRFSRTYRGKGTDIGREPQPMVPAVVNAVAQALADPEFVTVVARREGDGPDLATGIAPTGIRRCGAPSTAFPSRIEAALETVVVVRTGQSTGSGVIVSEDGYLLTAAHVVGDGDQALVRLRSGLEIPSRIVSRDRARDVALLKLPGRGYACAAATTQSGGLPLGSDVFTINVLEDSAPTVARGVVSGYQEFRGRRYIQTDASINPGSSGGPLFDRDGSVGGIVTFMAVNLEGHGFGVPIDDATSSLNIVWE